MTSRLLSALLTIVLFVPFPVAAQEEKSEEESAGELLTGVQDNSFLLEEGYNQEPGLVQHINLFLHDRDADAWAWLFTQEWPMLSMKHQISYTIPVTYADGQSTELGDIALNYRYQLIGDGESKLAIAPRLSIIFPTSEGNTATAVQFGFPLSNTIGRRVIAHTNVGATWFNRTHDTEYFAGQSFIYAMTPRVNALVEALWSGNGEEDSFVVSPGIRWAHNFASGLQIAPGLAYVMNVGDEDDGGDQLLLYLSFEHPFGRRK